MEVADMAHKEVLNSDLVDIRDVEINPSDSTEERVKSFVQQIKNPYHFRVGNVVVHVAYSDTEKSINDNFSNLLSAI